MFPHIYKEFKPAAQLAHYIKCYWLFEKDYNEGEFEHVFPDSSYELVYEQGVIYRVSNVRLPRLYVLGQLEKPIDFYAVGGVRQWAVRFYPWGLQPFGNLEKLREAVWQPGLEVLEPSDAHALETIMKQADDQKTIEQLDDFFIKRLLAWQFSDDVLSHAVDELKKQNGSIKLKDLAEYCFISQRQLARKISRATGRTPHDVASRLRFEQVRDAIMRNPDVPLTYLAGHYGYADQSHLIKEFRHYMEMTPSKYADITRSHQPRMKNAKNVQFLQFETIDIS